MALYRTVQMGFWTNPKIVDDFTPEDRYFYLYLFTNPHTNLCGCYAISISQMVLELGYSSDTIQRLIDRFSKVHNVIRYDSSTKEILLLNWYKYNWTESEKYITAIMKELEKVKNKEFKEYLSTLLAGEEYPIDTLSIPYEYPMVSSNANTNTNADTISNANTTSKTNNSRLKFANAKRIIEMYNLQCPSLPKAEKVTSERIRAVSNVLKEYTDDEIETLFVKAENSAFLRGEKGDWKANFDWLMNKKNIVKVLEGCYDRENRLAKVDNW